MPSSSYSHSNKDEASSMTSKTSDTSKGKRFKLKRAGNLLTTTGKPITELKGLGHDNEVEQQPTEAEPQSLFRRHSSNLGRGMKSIKRKLKELKTSADELKTSDLNDPGDDQAHIIDDDQSRRSSSWIRRTSLNLTRSLSRTSATSTPPSIEVTTTRPGRHSRSASEVLPPRPSLTLNRSVSGSSSSTKSGGRRLSLNFMRDRIGNAGDGGYQPTPLEDIVQSPIALSPDSEAMSPVTPTIAVLSPPQVTLSTSTGSAISAVPSSVQTFEIPPLLKSGTLLTKITAKKRQRVVVRADWEQGQIVWESKPGVWKFIPVEAIREVRTGASASFHLTQFNISQTYLPFWITIVYTASSTTTSPPLASSSSVAPESGHLAVSPPSTITRGSPLLSAISLPSLNALSPKILSGSNGFSYSGSTFKSLHLLCPSVEIFRAWEQTLKEMADVRAKLTDGLGFGMGGLNANREMEGMRRDMWERREFIGADTTPDSRLSFAEITKMCWKLNVRMNEGELKRLFISADTSHRGFLDFDDFKQFVKLLKARPELDRLYRKTIAKAAAAGKGKGKGDNEGGRALFTFDVFVDFMRNKQGSTLPESQLEAIFDRYSEPLSSQGPGSPPISLLPTPPAVSLMAQEKQLALPLPTPPASASASPMTRSSDLPALPSGPRDARDEPQEPDSGQETRVMSVTSFSSFLMSSDNPALLEPVGVEDDGGVGLSRYLHLPHHTSFHLPHLHIPHFGYGHHSHPPSPVGEREEEEKKQPQPLSVISHDMTRPLSEYFISSSHNTYLIGHQLVGESTIEGYVRALIGGCRSVEVDIYDSDNGNGPPMIYHGHTLTSKLSLREVCEAIMTYGFMESEYPIIISAEVHLSVPGQSQMAKIMREVFGDRLVTKEKEKEKWQQQSSSSPTVASPLDEDDAWLEDPELRAMSSWKIEQLPSPEELKGRILLKTKNLNLLNRKDTPELGSISPPSSWTGSGAPGMVDTTTTSSTSDTDGGAVFSDLENKARSILQRVRSTRGKSSTSASASEGAGSSPPSGGLLSRRKSSGPKDVISSPVANTPTSPATSASLTPTPSPIKREKSGSRKQKKEKVKMSPDLIPLLVYTVGVKCRGINKKEVYAPEEMFSLSENRAEAMLKTGSALDVIKHTRSHLVRIYPKGMRVSSSNYEPHRFWVMGAQLVAINWQTFGTGYTINHAMFQRNGRCGYVLKPLALRIPQSQKEILSKVAEHHFDVTVISAQHLPPDKTNKKDAGAGGVDPYVEVSLHMPDWNSVVDSCNLGTSLPGKMNGPNQPQTLSPPPMRTRSASSAGGNGGGGNSNTITYRTGVVKNNGFNPVWEEKLRIPFNCIGEAQGGMKDLIFVKFAVRTQSRGDKEEEPLAVFCASLGTLRSGYRHLPLYDAQMSQYLYSTLFVRIGVS